MTATAIEVAFVDAAEEMDEPGTTVNVFETQNGALHAGSGEVAREVPPVDMSPVDGIAT
jgi:hypothetical protein